MADQVILKNQDRVTGKVVLKDDDKLTFKSDHFGVITILWNQVQELRTDDPVTVVTNSGAESKTVLKPDEPSLQDIKALRDTAEQVQYERRLHPSWLQLWSGAATVGFAGAQGNAKTRIFTGGFTASRITRSDKTTAYFAAIRSSALVSGIQSETAQAVRGGWSYDHNVSHRLFLNGFNDYEYDKFQDLDLRFVIGGGLGYIAWQREHARLDLLAGVAWNHENFAPPTAPSYTRSTAEAYVGDQLSYILLNKMTIAQTFRYFPNLSESGLYRINFDLTATTQIYKWLTWNMAASDRFLSRPVAGRQKNDLLWTLGIGVKFAR